MPAVIAVPAVPQVHCGDPGVEARLEQSINDACISFEKKPQEVAQVGLTSNTHTMADMGTCYGDCSTNAQHAAVHTQHRLYCTGMLCHIDACYMTISNTSQVSKLLCRKVGCCQDV